MDKRKFLTKTGLAVSLSAILVTNAQANPFQAELLKTGYENGNTSASTTTDKNTNSKQTGSEYSPEGKIKDGECAGISGKVDHSHDVDDGTQDDISDAILDSTNTGDGGNNN